MPEPPRSNETQQMFLSRCISFMTENKEGNSPAQRAAVCYSMWRNRNKKSKEDYRPIVILKNEKEFDMSEEERKEHERFIKQGKNPTAGRHSFPEVPEYPEGFVKPKSYMEILEDEVRQGVPDRMGNFLTY